MYLKSLAIFTLIQKSLNLPKSFEKSQITLKSLKFSEKNFKMPRILKNSPAFSKKNLNVAIAALP
jgi:hypothetical protein